MIFFPSFSRIWYFTADDTFFDTKTLPAPCKFGYINYVPEGKNDSLGNMLKRLNADLKKKPVTGEKCIDSYKLQYHSTIQYNSRQVKINLHETVCRQMQIN